MCGIVGYVGNPGSGASAEHGGALDVVMEGLARLEYRGYDSAGVALVTDDGVDTRKKAGKLVNLVAELEADPLPESVTGIGHTRWATHGGPTDPNAHPHLGGGGRLALIHNGIIENFASLKAGLLADGVEFTSETDTEVVAHLLAATYDEVGDLTEAMRQVCNRLEGAFTLLAVHADQPGTVVGARRNSPLVVGHRRGRELPRLRRRGLHLAHPRGARARPGPDRHHHPRRRSRSSTSPASRCRARRSTSTGTPPPPRRAASRTSWPRRSTTSRTRWPTPCSAAPTRTAGWCSTSCGSTRTSCAPSTAWSCWPAAPRRTPGHVAKYAIEHWARVPVEVELSHEFRYRDPIVDDRTLVVAISQSGETMDTLMAVRYAREQGAQVVAVCNTHGSSIPRESQGVLYTHAGPEIAVASTKAFLAQITACYLLGLYLAELRGGSQAEAVPDVLAELHVMPEKIQRVLDGLDHVRELARWMADTRSVLFLGRHVGFPVAMEGALKLKELAYIHAEGFAAGELKHGPIALIEPGQPVFVVVPSPHGENSLHSKVVSNIQEIRARGARTIVIAEEGDERRRARSPTRSSTCRPARRC